jgi:hypothetical protein
MPSPSCTRCEGRSFEASPAPVGTGGAKFRLVYCTTCGSVVGAVPP